VRCANPRRCARVLRGVGLLEIGRIEDHEIGKLARGGGGHDRALEAALAKERQPAAMVEMGMGQKHAIDRGGVEAEGLGILEVERPAALMEAAIDQDALAGGLDQMARAGDVLGRAVKRYSHLRVAPLSAK